MNRALKSLPDNLGQLKEMLLSERRLCAEQGSVITEQGSVITEQGSVITEQESVITDLKQQYQNLLEQFRLSQHRQFGQSSETSPARAL